MQYHNMYDKVQHMKSIRLYVIYIYGNSCYILFIEFVL